MADWDGTERRNTGELTVLSAKLQSLHQDVSEIKGALNELTRAINKLAIIEERQTVTTASLERAFAAIAKIEERLIDIEKHEPEHQRVKVWVDKIVMLIVGAALMFVWDKIKGG